jgi:hypothetical protein
VIVNGIAPVNLRAPPGWHCEWPRPGSVRVFGYGGAPLYRAMVRVADAILFRGNRYVERGALAPAPGCDPERWRRDPVGVNMQYVAALLKENISRERVRRAFARRAGAIAGGAKPPTACVEDLDAKILGPWWAGARLQLSLITPISAGEPQVADVAVFQGEQQRLTPALVRRELPNGGTPRRRSDAGRITVAEERFRPPVVPIWRRMMTAPVSMRKMCLQLSAVADRHELSLIPWPIWDQASGTIASARVFGPGNHKNFGVAATVCRVHHAAIGDEALFDCKLAPRVWDAGLSSAAVTLNDRTRDLPSMMSALAEGW